MFAGFFYLNNITNKTSINIKKYKKSTCYYTGTKNSI